MRSFLNPGNVFIILRLRSKSKSKCKGKIPCYTTFEKSCMIHTSIKMINLGSDIDNDDFCIIDSNLI